MRIGSSGSATSMVWTFPKILDVEIAHFVWRRCLSIPALRSPVVTSGDMSLASLVPSRGVDCPFCNPGLPLSWHHLSFMVVSWILTCPPAIGELNLWFCLLVSLVLPMI